MINKIRNNALKQKLLNYIDQLYKNILNEHFNKNKKDVNKNITGNEN
jgi:ribosomal protein S17E